MLAWLRSLLGRSSPRATVDSTAPADDPTDELLDLSCLGGAAFSDSTAWDLVYSRASRASYWTDYLHAFTLEYLAIWEAFVPSPPARVLVPGCGASVAPHILASQGYEVVATDLSPEAIALQNWVTQAWSRPAGASQWDVRKRWLQRPSQREKAQGGTLEWVVADQRDPAQGGPFDLVFSERALQTMPRPDRQQVLRQQFAALTPEGAAFFVYVNTSDELRAEFEDDLKAAGFNVCSARRPLPARRGRSALTFYRWL